ncbi:class I SAM-dependent methyltransferase [Dictyobacter aurantiacus]|uniref:Methyltransferase n=1 Tax=Dictyobacter aurantiacus TaxID=1936993 RepID=A0A401ZS92_9CHLR|nr:class I SAM-dependent methyltransferase [Dictyobacter aurantiacus]GCE09672.1 methyltransferase [Dictyobacter aurantiacus]
MGEKADQALFDFLIEEYNHPFNGWDFSYLNGRMTSIRTNPAWDYTHIVTAAMKQAHILLDMHTGGGEKLAQLLAHQPVPEVYATELYAPNIIAARQRLTPLGVTVYTAPDGRLPFSDQTLDLVINRHGSYTPSEVLRILKPGQMFITQQVGDQTNARLHELLGRHKQVEHPWNIDYAARQMEEAGGHVVERKEELFMTRFQDVGAIVYYLKAVPWEVPDFSIEKYWHQLVDIHHLLQQQGSVDIPFHSFLLIVQKS